MVITSSTSSTFLPRSAAGAFRVREPERAGEVVAARVGAESGLGAGGARTEQRSRQTRRIERVRGGHRQPCGLIEAALAQPRGMQGNLHDQIGTVVHWQRARQPPAQVHGERRAPLELQGVDQMRGVFLVDPCAPAGETGVRDAGFGSVLARQAARAQPSVETGDDLLAHLAQHTGGIDGSPTFGAAGRQDEVFDRRRLGREAPRDPRHLRAKPLRRGEEAAHGPRAETFPGRCAGTPG